jgi:hypothetical protein
MPSKPGQDNLSKWRTGRVDERQELVKNAVDIALRKKIAFSSQRAAEEYIGEVVGMNRATLNRNPKYSIHIKKLVSGHRDPKDIKIEDLTRQVVSLQLKIAKISSRNAVLEKIAENYGAENGMEPAESEDARSLETERHLADVRRLALVLIQHLDGILSVDLSNKRIEDLSKPKNRPSRVVASGDYLASFLDWYQGQMRP